MATDQEELTARLAAKGLLAVAVAHKMTLDETVELLASALLMTEGHIDDAEAGRRLNAVVQNASVRRHPAGSRRGAAE